MKKSAYQSEAIVEGLKQLLRSRNMSYAALAKELDLSLTSVKRVFSEKTFTLHRLEEICNVLGINFLDLVNVSNIQSQRLMQYTAAQDDYIASTPKIFALWNLILNGHTVKEFRKRGKITENELVSALRKFDQLKLIEWQAGDKIRILVDRETRWRPGGQLRKKYGAASKKEFLDSDFQGQNEFQAMFSLALTEAQTQKAITQLHSFVEEWGRASDMERRITNRPDDLGFIFAVRPFVFSPLRDFWKS